ncbi:MAG: hypothetical protein ACXQS8_02965 [Candidatus Helarchaeales archaeon]
MMDRRRAPGKFVGFGEKEDTPPIETKKKKSVKKIEKKETKKKKDKPKKERVSEKKEKKDISTYTWQLEHFQIMLADGKDIMVALMLDSEPTDSIKQSLIKFTQDFESRFQKQLKHFQGNVRDFDDAKKLCENEFNLFLMQPQVFPLSDAEIPMNKLTAIQKTIVKRGRELSKERGFFFIAPLIDDLIKTKGYPREKIIQGIFGLRDLNVLRSVDVEKVHEEADKIKLWSKLEEIKGLPNEDKKALFDHLIEASQESREHCLLKISEAPKKKLSNITKKILVERKSLCDQREQLFQQLEFLLQEENLEQAAKVLLQIAEYSERLGERSIAQQLRARASEFSQKLQQVRQQVPLLRTQLGELMSRGKLFESNGKYKDAINAFTEAARIATEIGDFDELKKCEDSIHRIQNLMELARLRESLH